MARSGHRRTTSKRFLTSSKKHRTRRVFLESLESRQLLAGDAAASVTINELHVNPSNETQLIEFVELYNPSAEAVDLSGWFFADGIDYRFPEGTQLPAGGYVVVGENPTEFTEKFSLPALGPWVGKLRNEGELVELRSRDGQLIDEVNYQLGFPWPTVGDAPDASIQLIRADLDNNLGGAWRSAAPTPAAANSVSVLNAPPMLRQVTHLPEQPSSGQDVTITVRVTDSDSVGSVTLAYQLVEPGQYIRRSDPAYETNWTNLPMVDNGTSGDQTAGDSIYTVIIPGSLQVHRRLVRYRITAEDALTNRVTGPYADDPQPNFAYFVYDGVPDWTGSKRPGTLPAVTYKSDTLTTLPTYHLIAVEQDVTRSQYNQNFNLREFQATMVYDGVVYDHITFRNRGRASTYQVGKNKWKINFTRGHSFQARDNNGNRYSVDWDKINILPGTNPWWRNDVSTDGTVLFEPVAFRLYELAGTPSPHTQYFQFRVIDGAEEASATSQYEGDFWGLYIAIQQPDGRFLDERGLPDGSVFNIHGSAAGSSIRHQGSLLPENKSDLTAFIRDSPRTNTLEWWEQNLNFDAYFGWNAINLAVNNSDLRPSENVNYYHNQENNQWYTIPWDLDLTFEDRPHLSRPDSQWESIQLVFNRYPTIKQLYQNRVRELLDLLLDNGDAAKVVSEYAGFLLQGDPENSVVDANQAMWDYHPRKTKKGIWYKNFTPALMPNPSFAGLEKYMQTFLTPGGYGRDRLAAKATDAAIPERPTIESAGEANFPVNRVRLRSSAFVDPDGADSFARMEWRVAEVNLPGIAGYDANRPNLYEIEGTRWESGELNVWTPEIDVPVGSLESGRTYRARVRVQDATGKWSHWSLPLEFVTTAGQSDLVSSLRVSEVHYHPADPSAAELAAGFTNSDDFEFLEFVNIGPLPLVLDGAKLEKRTINNVENGIDFDFTRSAIRILQPGQRVVVVEDLEAFQFRYGNALPVAGEWSGGQLGNGGETITVTALGNLVQQFAYDDGWHTTTDGAGPSLEIVNALQPDLNSWSTASAWRASRQIGGSPGTDGSTRIAGDANEDGVFNSGDLIFVFQAGEYEDTIAKNSTWAEGDWDGDGDFTTADLVYAFQAGTYVAGARPASRSVDDEFEPLAEAALTPLPSTQRREHDLLGSDLVDSLFEMEEDVAGPMVYVVDEEVASEGL